MHCTSVRECAHVGGEPRTTVCEDERVTRTQYVESVAANKSTGACSMAHLLMVVAVAGLLACALVVVADAVACM